MFVDEATIKARSGDGGRGAVSLRREKHVPRGGPDGGNGGRGGAVIVRADVRLTTLVDLQYKRRYQAESGADGAGGLKNGSDAEDVLIRVPVGTVVTDRATGTILVDLTEDGQSEVVARGGKGGRGNAVFATSTRQTPRFAEKGEPGESCDLRLELKLLADVGIVGMPNGGKSTLIARVSSARPRIADYPFTTLTPNLGVVSLAPGESFVVADVPGLVEGASEGKGLGHQFLRHLERTRVLVHVLDCSGMTGRAPLDDFDAVNGELARYGSRLRELDQLVALNKTDLPTAAEAIEEVQPALVERGYAVFPISAVTGAGVPALMYALGAKVKSLPSATPLAQPKSTEVVRFTAEPEEAWEAQRVNEHEFVITGKRIERLVVMTDLSREADVERFQGILESMGVVRRLRELGAEEGDSVRIGAEEFDFEE